MGDQRDYKAEFGHAPTWDLQREKQEAAAREYFDEMTEEEVREWLDSEADNDDK